MKWLILAGVLVLYFVPAAVAALKRHARAWGVFWLNLLLGWTLIGWAVVLVWALAAPEAGPGPEGT